MAIGRYTWVTAVTSVGGSQWRAGYAAWAEGLFETLRRPRWRLEVDWTEASEVGTGSSWGGTAPTWKFLTAPLLVDGIFGGDTETAVIDFQANNGLDADGIVGPRTREALGL